MQDPAPRVRRPRRGWRWALGALAVLLVVAGVVLGPRWRGIRLWQDLTGDEALDAGARGLFAVPLPRPAEGGAPWTPMGWIARFPDAMGPPRSTPGLLLVHGLSPDGLADLRVQRAVHAFGRAGFLVLAPEIASMRWPGHHAPDVDGLADELSRLTRPDLAPVEADPSRHGAVGVSLGGALLVRAVARCLARGEPRPRALLLLGVPYDLRPLLARWSAAAPPGASPAEVEDHRFARSGVLAAAVPGLFGERSDVCEALLAWLATAWVPEGDPATDDAEALSFARHVRDVAAEPAWRARVEAAAWERLAPLSLAQHPEDLEALRGIPVFLLHGRRDALIPVGQMQELARRLPGARALASDLLGHAEIGEAGLGTRWAHVTWVDDFLDTVDD